VPQYYAWEDLLAVIDACNGVFAPAGACSNQYFPGGTPQEIADHFASDNYEEHIDTSSLLSDIVHTTTVDATITDTRIELTIIHDHQESATYDRNTANPSSYTNDRHGEMTLVIELDHGVEYEYTSDQLNEDVEELLALWDLTDHSQYSWHHSCVYPLVFYDETYGTPDVGFEDCDWEDTAATSGGESGNGFTGEVIGAPPESGGPTHFYDMVLDGTLPQSAAFKSVDAGTKLLWACKYAEIIADGRPAFSWSRPCEADGALLDDNEETRYPDAWHLCGCVDVLTAEQTSEGVIDLTFASTGTLEVGDELDFTGVGGLGNNVEITAIGATVTVGGTLSGAYSGGGTVKQSGSPACHCNDTESRGDYLAIFYEHSNRDFQIDPDLRVYNANCYGMPRNVTRLDVIEGNIPITGTYRVVSISPAGDEVWDNGDAYAFDHFSDIAMPLDADERFGAVWIANVVQRMLDPIDGYVVTNPATPNAQLTLKWVEARATPVGGCPWPQDPSQCLWQGDTHGNNQCPAVAILPISRITELADDSMGDVCPEPTVSGGPADGKPGKIAPPVVVCYAFDDDVTVPD